MLPIADSSAVLDKRKLLPQHQVALTHIHTQASKPNVHSFRWLDLCCGKGQIIVNLEDNFPEEIRHKIEFHIQDINTEFLKVAQRKAEELKFNKVEIYPSKIEHIDKVLPKELLHDFITLINATHELSPFFLPTLFYECLLRLARSGTLYVYDMVTINPPELGALTWTRDEIQEIVTSLISVITLPEYRPTAIHWGHSTCDAWSIEIQKEYLKPTEEIEAFKPKIIENAEHKISELLDRKLLFCSHALESIMKYGAGTSDGEKEKMQYLFDFYSISRMLKQ